MLRLLRILKIIGMFFKADLSFTEKSTFQLFILIVSELLSVTHCCFARPSTNFTCKLECSSIALPGHSKEGEETKLFG